MSDSKMECNSRKVLYLEHIDSYLLRIRKFHYVFPAVKDIQIGGLTLSKASSADGRIHNPSPQINPEATAGTIKSAFLLLSLCHTYTIKLPAAISIAKEAPTRKGTAIAIGRGTNFPTLSGAMSLTKLASTANAKKP